VLEKRLAAKRILHELNGLHPDDADRRNALLQGFLGKAGERMTFDGHFHCDYGFSIELGVDFCANVDLVILDGAKVAIGKNCFIAPNLGTDFWRGMFYGLYMTTAISSISALKVASRQR
jgi:acetyltransferase-like isoleucine patch superfamily enzyme